MNRRTSPSRRCACTRAPSSFHSTDASPVWAQRVGDVGGRRREHRARPPAPGAGRPRASPSAPPANARPAVAAKLPRQHVRPPHRGRRARRRRRRSRRSSRRRALPDAARRRARPTAGAARSRSPDRTPTAAARGARRPTRRRWSRRSWSSQRSTSRISRLGVDAGSPSSSAERAPPDADASLTRLAGQHTDGHHDLVGGQRAQRRGEELALVGALRRRRHPLGHLGERDEQHVVTLRRRRTGVGRDSGARNRA